MATATKKSPAAIKLACHAAHTRVPESMGFVISGLSAGLIARGLTG